MQVSKARRLAASIGLSVAVTLCGCSFVLDRADDAYVRMSGTLVPRIEQGLKHPGELTVGIRREAQIPFVLESRGHASGLDVEVGAALANEMGLPVSFVYVDDVLDALGHTCDCVMEVDTQEALGFEVLNPYMYSAVAIFRVGEPGIVSASDLEGSVIAVQEGSASEAVLDSTALTVTKLPVASLGDGFAALAAGQCNYCLGHAMPGSYLARTMDNVSFAGTLTDPTALSIAVPGGDDPVSAQLRSSLEVLSTNGVLNETLRRWLGDTYAMVRDSRVADVPMPVVESVELEVIGAVDGDGTSAGSNAVTVSASYGSAYGEDEGYYY